MIALMWLAVAHASDYSVGFTRTYNDPFLKTRGLVVGATRPIAPALRVGVLGGVFLELGDRDWTSATRTMVEELNVSPDISRRTWDGSAFLIVEPFRGRVGPVGSALGLYAGVGAAQTSDDLEALQAEDQPTAIATQEQVHLTQVWGTTSDLFLSETIMLRLRWHHVTFIETIDSDILEMKGNAQLGLEVVFAPGARSGMGQPTAALSGPTVAAEVSP